jgi:hypothetical protein
VVFFGSPSTSPSFFKALKVVDPIAEHALVAEEHLAVPQVLAHGFELDPLQVQRLPDEPVHDLRGAELPAGAAGKQDAAVERTVGIGPCGKSRVDLVDLLLRERGQVLRRDLREIGRQERVFVLDLGEIHLLPVVGAVGRELDVRRSPA